MKRTLLALATLAAACTGSPATGYRATGAQGPSTSTTASSSTTTEPATTTTSTAPPTTAPAPTSSVPPPPTTAVAPSPNPPGPDPTARSGVGGTTTASWYGAESGAHTANGDPYDPDGFTFAHRSLAFGTAVRFCRGGACVVARCTDRGPESWTGRDFDLSRGTFEQLAPLSAGVATVTWAVVG